MPRVTSGAQRTLSPRSRIYRCLYESEDFCSKQTLARRCEISMPTLYQNLSELMDAGLVGYSGEEQSTGGRKAHGLAIIPDARFAVGISVTENCLRLSAVDLKFRELAFQKVPFVAVSQLSEQTGALAEILEAFLDENRLERARLLGVGVAIPGVIAPSGDRVFMAPTLRLRNTPLGGLYRDIPYPVRVENDANCGGYAEWFLRGGEGNMAYLSLEYGVGGAVLIDGVPYVGDHRRSGEFGHVCVETGGLPCGCGRRGCLEAYCSIRRISDDLGVPLKEFFRRAEAHEPECETLLYDVLRHLATG
ncbi:MAG: ROK family transcriptional regulator, partial [Oscillospiraceae bacterium]|nr:ROK family transcriptional regulator [Oscillospiraceae bacterium]